MRIRTLLRVSFAAALLLVLGLGILNWQLTQRITDLSVRLAQAGASLREVSRVLVLTHEYALHAEERVAQQLRAGLAALAGPDNAGYGSDSDASTRIPDEVRRQATTLGELFAHLEAASQPPETPLQIRRERLLLDQMLANVGILSESLERWEEAVRAEHDEID